MYNQFDINKLVQQVSGAQRAHRLHLHRQQWVQPKWYQWLCDLDLGQLFFSKVQNIILWVEGIQMPYKLNK